MSGTLALAQHVAQLSPAALETLVRQRKISSPEKVADTIALAGALLQKDSLTHALASLTGQELGALLLLAAQAGGQESGRGVDAVPAAVFSGLATKGLIAASELEVNSSAQGSTRADATGAAANSPAAGFTQLDEVTAAVTAAISSQGLKKEQLFAAATATPASELAAATTAAATHDTQATASDFDSWKPAILTAHAELLELGFALQGYPARTGRGTKLQTSALQVLHERTHIPQERIQTAVRVLAGAGYAVADTPTGPGWDDKRYLRLTCTGHKALLAPDTGYCARWINLAQAILQQLHPKLLSALSTALTTTQPAAQPGSAPTDSIPAPHSLAAALETIYAEYPLLQRVADAGVQEFLTLGTYLGMCADGLLTPATQLLLQGKITATENYLRGELPAETETGYVQPDLSIILSGAPAADRAATLITASAPEQLGAAQVRRITRGSLRSALGTDCLQDAAQTNTATQHLREQLTALSLSALPQPLEYLLTELATKPARIRVQQHPDDPEKSIIKTSTHEDARELMSDRGLALLRLRPSLSSLLTPGAEHHLICALTWEMTYTALRFARYDAVCDVPQKHSTTNVGTAPAAFLAPPEAETATDPLAALLTRVRAALDAGGTDSIQMILELAIAQRLTLHLTATARGQNYEFTVVPLSINSGRLRVRDEAADTERTLPVESITAVQPANSPAR